MLASNIITSELVPSHCVYCSFLHGKKNDTSTNQSSLLLKELIAQGHKEFDSHDQQDPSEFLNSLTKDCHFLSQLTKSEIITSYTCGKCKYFSDNSDSDERFKNVISLSITGYLVTFVDLTYL